MARSRLSLSDRHAVDDVYNTHFTSAFDDDYEGQRRDHRHYAKYSRMLRTTQKQRNEAAQAIDSENELLPVPFARNRIVEV